jgi:hypothetical protein
MAAGTEPATILRDARLRCSEDELLIRKWELPINSDLMVRSAPKRKLRRASRTMARIAELATILRDACLRQGEDKLLRIRAECLSSAAGRTHR